MTVTPLRERAAWKALERHHAEIAGRSLRELFAEDPGRGKRFAAEAAGIYLDYSKNLIDAATLRLLLDLAEESDLAGRRDRMFRGEHINVSEDRAACTSPCEYPPGPPSSWIGSMSSARSTTSLTA
jgi:glucose-6-phosphate isomerase